MASRDLPAPGRADPAALMLHVEALQGERHAETSPAALERAFQYARQEMEAAGWDVEVQPFLFRGRERRNLVASRPGDGEGPRMLLGAHLDTVRGTPGADDNASGVAGVLEAARLLAGRDTPHPVELVVWDQEERSGWTYRVGSRRQVRAARRAGVRYAGALVLEMIGYRTLEPGSQRVPLPVRWMDLRRTGDFLAVVGDLQSRRLLRHFLEASRRASPGLPLQSLTVPARGWAVWAARRSDNASFWSNGVPALMLTDTADLRNPHYHRASDRSDTLDYDFMAAVVDAGVEALASFGA